jgi:acyl carrier protein
MTNDQAYAVLSQMLHELAPELDIDDVDKDANLNEELDLDSISFLNLIEMIHERTGVDVPESDYAQLESVNACSAYLVRHGN